jgi:cytochrome c biogenesis protein
MAVQGYGTVAGIDYQENWQGQGPALLVELKKDGKAPERVWLPQGKADFDRKRGDSAFFLFEGLQEVLYTGLQVAKDPGVNTVWAGCLLMCVGIMVAFFMSHQRVWIRVAPGADGRVDVALAGATTRNRLAFQGRFEKIQSDLKGAEGA